MVWEGLNFPDGKFGHCSLNRRTMSELGEALALGNTVWLLFARWLSRERWQRGGHWS